MQNLPNDLQEYILNFSNPYKEYFKKNIINKIDPSILLIHNGCEHCYIIKLKNLIGLCDKCYNNKKQIINPKIFSLYTLSINKDIKKLVFALSDIQRILNILCNSDSIYTNGPYTYIHYEIRRGPLVWTNKEKKCKILRKLYL